ncbi:uncharacterized protein EV422DRAFT_547067 [Fimicolochytrium jonesii]|uniref:uncharacterized protein n=1 Tax=Fimicolochytrium jonesii TaxID=1396493 RepID=UPI0022FE9CFD|nr:uncharacterized protein EV422DRAFT_547067 [Fimicolochytrium jonesii]KAI8816189.1 hypothetical protein EV422DRAFT_547067 [Fimicolochytrium jonesii]
MMHVLQRLAVFCIIIQSCSVGQLYAYDYKVGVRWVELPNGDSLPSGCFSGVGSVSEAESETVYVSGGLSYDTHDTPVYSDLIYSVTTTHNAPDPTLPNAGVMSWAELDATLPSPRFGHVSEVVNGHYLVVHGGHDATPFEPSLYEENSKEGFLEETVVFDMSVTPWGVVTLHGGPAVVHAGSFAHGGRMFVQGGWIAGTDIAEDNTKLWALDSTTHPTNPTLWTWSEQPIVGPALPVGPTPVIVPVPHYNSTTHDALIIVSTVGQTILPDECLGNIYICAWIIDDLSAATWTVRGYLMDHPGYFPIMTWYQSRNPFLSSLPDSRRYVATESGWYPDLMYGAPDKFILVLEPEIIWQEVIDSYSVDRASGMILAGAENTFRWGGCGVNDEYYLPTSHFATVYRAQFVSYYQTSTLAMSNPSESAISYSADTPVDIEMTLRDKNGEVKWGPFDDYMRIDAYVVDKDHRDSRSACTVDQAKASKAMIHCPRSITDFSVEGYLNMVDELPDSVGYTIVGDGEHVSLDLSWVTGDGVGMARQGTVARFYVHIVDMNGVDAADKTKLNVTFVPTIFDVNTTMVNGYVQIDYLPTTLGLLAIHISHNGQPLRQSPYTLNVTTALQPSEIQHTWVYTTGHYWESLTTTGSIPPERCECSMSNFPDDSAALLTGGLNGTDVYSDMYTFNYTTLEWTLLDTTLLKPSNSHASAMVGGFAVFNGGFDADMNSLPTGTVFDVENGDVEESMGAQVWTFGGSVVSMRSETVYMINRGSNGGGDSYSKFDFTEGFLTLPAHGATLPTRLYGGFAVAVPNFRNQSRDVIISYVPAHNSDDSEFQRCGDFYPYGDKACNYAIYEFDIATSLTHRHMLPRPGMPEVYAAQAPVLRTDPDGNRFVIFFGGEQTTGFYDNGSGFSNHVWALQLEPIFLFEELQVFNREFLSPRTSAKFMTSPVLGEEVEGIIYGGCRDDIVYNSTYILRRGRPTPSLTQLEISPAIKGSATDVSCGSGESFSVWFRSRNQKGELLGFGGDSINGIMRHKVSPVSLSCEFSDAGNGTYVISCLPFTSGVYELQVFQNSLPVGNSTILVEVVAGVNATAKASYVEKFIDGSVAAATVGSASVYKVGLRDMYGNPISDWSRTSVSAVVTKASTGALRRRAATNDKVLPSTVRVENSTAYVSFIPDTAGSFSIGVKLNDQDVSGSPFEVQALPAADVALPYVRRTEPVGIFLLFLSALGIATSSFALILLLLQPDVRHAREGLSLLGTTTAYVTNIVQLGAPSQELCVVRPVLGALSGGLVLGVWFATLFSQRAYTAIPKFAPLVGMNCRFLAATTAATVASLEIIALVITLRESSTLVVIPTGETANNDVCQGSKDLVHLYTASGAVFATSLLAASQWNWKAGNNTFFWYANCNTAVIALIVIALNYLLGTSVPRILQIIRQIFLFIGATGLIIPNVHTLLVKYGFIEANKRKDVDFMSNMTKTPTERAAIGMANIDKQLNMAALAEEDAVLDLPPGGAVAQMRRIPAVAFMENRNAWTSCKVMIVQNMNKVLIDWGDGKVTTFNAKSITEFEEMDQQLNDEDYSPTTHHGLAFTYHDIPSVVFFHTPQDRTEVQQSLMKESAMGQASQGIVRTGKMNVTSDVEEGRTQPVKSK